MAGTRAARASVISHDLLPSSSSSFFSPFTGVRIPPCDTVWPPRIRKRIGAKPIQTPPASPPLALSLCFLFFFSREKERGELRCAVLAMPRYHRAAAALPACGWWLDNTIFNETLSPPHTLPHPSLSLRPSQGSKKGKKGGKKGSKKGSGKKSAKVAGEPEEVLPPQRPLFVRSLTVLVGRTCWFCFGRGMCCLFLGGG